MGYGNEQVAGGYTVFPTVKRPKSPRGSGAGAGRGGGTRKRKRPLKVPKTLSYAKVTSKNPLRAPTAVETLVGGAVAPKAYRTAQRVLARIAQGPAAKTAALAALRAAPAATAGVLVAAGLMAYALTRAGLTAFAMKKATLRENAARAADAYRFARQKMADDQGYPLNKTQLKEFANAFKNRLLELGLSSRDLSRIMGRSAYEPSSTIPYSM